MSSLDLSHLSPGDGLVALRSFPRRYREALAPHGGESIDEVANRMGPGGSSALDVVDGVTRTWGLLGEALRQTLETTDPVLHSAVTDPAAREWGSTPHESVAEALGLFAAEAGQLAGAVEAVRSDEWAATASVAGGGTVTALDLLREAVRAGADGLRQVEDCLGGVR